MKTEAEVRARLEHWNEVLSGIIRGEETKKTIKHIIEELEWVLEGAANIKVDQSN